MTVLQATPLTAAAFADYGDVIESSRNDSALMNAATFERFDDLCKIDIANNERVAVSIARCVTPSALPLSVAMVERHPLGSQAFVPLGSAKIILVVAPPGDDVDVAALRAFVTDGRQGFNYHRGTWHMPLASFDAGQEYLIIDRADQQQNCDLYQLPQSIAIEVPEPW